MVTELGRGAWATTTSEDRKEQIGEVFTGQKELAEQRQMFGSPWRRLLRIASRVLITLIVGVTAAWGAFALWYQLPGGHALRAVGVTFWVVFSSHRAGRAVEPAHRARSLGIFGGVCHFAALVAPLPPSNDPSGPTMLPK